MKRLIISGANGRMGREIAALCREYGFSPVAGVDVKTESQNNFPHYSSFALCREKADLLIDFSHAAHLPQTLDFAVQAHLPLIVGTTGLDDKHEALLDRAAQTIPVMYSVNFSPAMQIMQQLAREAAQSLKDFDIEIIDRHHAQKADAPGGTALQLYSAVAAPAQHPVYGRHTALKKRSPQEIGMHALRGGSLRGTHEVGFYGPGEHLLLIHTAEDRSVFARGALQCGQWLLSQPPGRYTMADCVKKRE